MKKFFLLFLILTLYLLIFTSCDLINGTADDTANSGVCEHEWAAATCKVPKTCTKCGEIEGTKGTHNFADATCQAPKTCTVCSKTEGEKSDHDYLEANCTDPKKCKTCGVPYGLALGHKYSPATCTVPKICDVCGYENGSPLEHDYTAATCTEGEICKDCGAKGKNALDHNVITVTTDPTCTIDGCETTCCSRCNLVFSTTVIPKINHADLPYKYNGDTTVTTDGTTTAKCPHCNYSDTRTLVGSSDLISSAFAGKKISVLGDSISTYENYSSGIAADTTNSTIRNNIVWNGYSPSKPVFGGTSVDSTWWQRTINALGATLLVNNSNSGASVYDAVVGPCMQLHDNTGENAGEKPDIIFIYLGTNDNNRTIGSASSLSMSNIQELANSSWYKTPSNLAEAYAVMLYRVKKAYPDAEIFCLTNLERSDMPIEKTHAVSQLIRDVAGLFDDVHIADIGLYSGITRDNPAYELYMPKDTGNKSLHPGVEGMKEISRVLLQEIAESSRYIPEEFYELLDETAQN